jgi:hypothetical protein
LRHAQLKRIFENTWIQGLVLFLFALLFFSSWYKNIVFTIFQGRDLRRTVELLNGNWIWHGPDLSAGGYTPGPFYYWLMALPFSIFKSWESLVWFNFFLMSGAAVILWFIGRSLASVFAGFLLYFLFLNSQLLTELMKTFWHPSFLFIFQALLVYWLIRLPKNKKLLPAISLVIGLTLQIHYLQSIFLLALLANIAISKQPKKEKIRDLIIVGAFTILPLLPYIIWMFGQDHQFQTQIFSNSTTGIGDNLREIAAEKLAPLIALVWIFAIIEFFKKDKIFNFKNNLLSTAWIFSILAWIPLSYDLLFTRFTEASVLLTYVLSAPMLERLEERHRRFFYGGFTLATGWYLYKIDAWKYVADILAPLPILFIASGVLVLFLFPLKTKHRPVIGLLMLVTLSAFLAKLSQGEARGTGRKYDNRAVERAGLLEALAEKTGWDYKTFREHTFIVGIHREDELQFIYQQYLEKRTPGMPKSQYDGILVINRNTASFLGPNSEPDWDKLRSKIPDEFYLAAIRNELKCQETKKIGNFEICFYEFKDSEIQFTWNNLGYPYLFRQPALVSINESQGVERPDSVSWVFYINSCENFDPVCSIYFMVKQLKEGFLEVTVLGDPLGMPNPIPNPLSYLTLNDLKIEVDCKNKGTELFTLASQMGIKLNADGSFTQGFLTPYQQIIPQKCKSLERLAVVANTVHTGSIYGGWKDSPFRIEWARVKQ